MTKPKPFILIDGSSYLYRAFHALPPLSNTRGEPTGAIYGVINMIRKLINDYDPEYIAVIFDPKGKVHRDEIYEYYKANRPPMPDELGMQIQPLHDVIKAMGLPLIIVEGEEADDVIGTLVEEARKQNIPVLISTGDKDMAQLVNENVTLINTMTNVILDPKGVKEKFGVTPEQMIDYLTLIGDSSDNIPGVPKVGPKTAAKWIEQYVSLDEIIKHAQEISGKVGENLRETVPQLPLSKELLTIRKNLSLNIHLKDLVRQPMHREVLVEWFRRLEFKSWLAELLEHIPTERSEGKYKIILNETEVQTLWEKLLNKKVFAFDIETTSLNPIDAELVGASISLNPHQAVYIPVGHDYPGAPKQFPKEKLISLIKGLLENPNITLIGQNLKYDFTVLEKYGIALQAKFFDTMLESYVLNSAVSRHDLETLTLKYLGHRKILFEEVAGKGSKQVSFNQVSLDKALTYSGEDADIALQLHQLLFPKIKKDAGLQYVFEKIELPLVPVLSRMEGIGVLVDAKQLQQISLEFAKRIKELETQAYQMAGKVFNLSSPKQLQDILYQELKIPAFKRTPTGQLSTSEAVLQELARDHALPKIILEHRSLSKLKSTYADALVEQINPQTGRVHTSYNQAVTTTGRLSSTDPNLQNIPIRNEAGRRIRQAFVGPPGYKIVAADYSQIELRIMAHLSKDEGLIEAFHKSYDIHTATAAEVFEVSLANVTSEQRRNAKAINFGLMYGMSIFGLSEALDVERGIAQQYMDLYFSRYPKVKQFMDEIRIQAHQTGYVETFFGRRLYLPEINVSNLMRRRAAERAAINGPMQGTAADIIKLAMIEVDRWIKSSNLDVKMIMQVHDELVFEIAEPDVEKAIPYIRDNMTKVIQLSVPVVVEIGIGNNWDEAH